LIPATHEAPILMAIVEIKFIAPDYTTARAAKFVGRRFPKRIYQTKI